MAGSYLQLASWLMLLHSTMQQQVGCIYAGICINNFVKKNNIQLNHGFVNIGGGSTVEVIDM